MEIDLPPTTDRLRFAMARANRAAAQLGHDAILPEHMLLGLIQDEAGVAARALKTLNVDLTQLHDYATAQAGIALEQRQNPHADSRQILKDAKEQADLLEHDAIGTGHLLLALFKTLERMTPQSDVDLPVLREAVLDLLPSDESAS